LRSFRPPARSRILDGRKRKPTAKEPNEMSALTIAVANGALALASFAALAIVCWIAYRVDRSRHTVTATA
jgi:hypothetical protein